MRPRGDRRPGTGDGKRHAAELIASLGGEHVIEFQWQATWADARPDPTHLIGLPAVTHVRDDSDRMTLSVTEPHVALPALLTALPAMGCELTGLTTRHASLEDVFVKVAGRHLNEAEEAVASGQ